MSRRADFEQRYPGAYFLDAEDPAAIATYLARRGWIEPDERFASAVIAGAGNMNCTVRVTTSARSLILKQARPWVEKYPQIEAPAERALVEGRFYELVASRPQLAAMMPRLIGLDPASHLLALEDLGAAADLTSVYRGVPLAGAVVDGLATYLADLHALDVGDARQAFTNRAMRALNHAYIFELPLDEGGGLDLDAITPGLGALARSLRQDARYRAQVTVLGRRYLEDGPTLLHGDFFPGSWLSTAAGTRVIDPEFCFCGPRELDLGVMIAHLHLAQQEPALIPRLLARHGDPVDRTLVEQFAGVEIMRRLIGLAQLPVSASLEQKARLLDLSRALVLR